MNVLKVKPGVEFTLIAPAGFRLLGALEATARGIGLDLTITSACDGEHSGPTDPHHKGEAYDVRSKGLPLLTIEMLIHHAILALCDEGEVPVAASRTSYTTNHFFGFLEQAGTANEHLHFQRRRNTVYP